MTLEMTSRGIADHDTTDGKGIAKQRTLKSSIGCSGIGLHSGSRISMTLLPAAPNTGIVFRRVDIAGKGAEIPARWDHVVDTRMCTVIGNADGVTVGTVEHLMAALAGMEIDNLVIEINGAEVPVMDGSAGPFVFLIECAGVAVQDAPRKAIRILKDVEVTAEDGAKRAALRPADGGLSVDFRIEFNSQAITSQHRDVGLSPWSFRGEIARARTFGFLEEVAMLQKMGLALGGSLDNAVVVSGEKILNEDGLRFEDEFVRHKILDAVGDLYLTGAPIIGRHEAERSGHMLTNTLLRALFADSTAWELIDAPADMTPRRAAIDAAAHRVAATA